jgi:hypothetical protein
VWSTGRRGSDLNLPEIRLSEPARPDWAQIRHRYEATQDPVADIVAEAGVARRDFDNQRRREGWRRLNPRPFPAGRRASPEATGEAPMPVPAEAPVEDSPDEAGAFPVDAPLPAADRRRLLERLVSAIAMKLSQLERRMTADLAKGDDTPATDHERETRAIGALIDNLEKITELETGLAGNAPGRRGADAASDLADEAERCRQELAERLSRLVAAAGGQP